jgi:predicted enzyme related to lactoylglutathione lyase
MKRVTGIGGIFFKSHDPEALKQWYVRHLGFPLNEDGGVTFSWEMDHRKKGATVWAPFPRQTDYFNPSEAPFMINYRVENLDALLAQLRKEGVTVEERVEFYDYGRFGWIMDPEGNRIELWEPR